MTGIRKEGESDFTPGPGCNYSGWCGKRCQGAQTIDQGITDDQNGTESGNLANIVSRITCQNYQAEAARDRASDYLAGKI
jgi:hypothetical protein